MIALTSLSPNPARASVQAVAVRSWREAGLAVRSVNWPGEVEALHRAYPEVEFVPPDRPAAVAPYVPINALLAVAPDGPVLVINSDIELALAPWALRRLRWLADGGLCYFVRHNHEGMRSQAKPERWGIDAFLLAGADRTLFPASSLSMGRPFWDYWMPWTFMRAGRSVLSVEYPAAYHQKHPRAWSGAAWLECAREFARLNADPAEWAGHDVCLAMSRRVRAEIQAARRLVGHTPQPGRALVADLLRRGPRGAVLELGAHHGEDTAWLAPLAEVVHAFEPDPRNLPVLQAAAAPNVQVIPRAVSDREGEAVFHLSGTAWGGREWTESSSLLRPSGHLKRYPVTFKADVRVETVTLDGEGARLGLGDVTLVWADLQGAEGAMVRGGQRTLARTRYLYTEYGDTELYAGQPSLDELIASLPGRWRVLELWPGDVLLENAACA